MHVQHVQCTLHHHGHWLLEAEKQGLAASFQMIHLLFKAKCVRKVVHLPLLYTLTVQKGNI